VTMQPQTMNAARIDKKIQSCICCIAVFSVAQHHQSLRHKETPIIRSYAIAPSSSTDQGGGKRRSGITRDNKSPAHRCAELLANGWWTGLQQPVPKFQHG
jgi:hypothetical protein